MTCSDDASTSRGSTITGVFAASPFDLLRTYLLNAYDLPDVFASVYNKMIAAWKVDLEERVLVHAVHPQPSSTCLRVSKEIPLEFTGFGAQYGPRLLSLSSLDSRVKRARTSLSEKTWLFHDQELECSHSSM